MRRRGFLSSLLGAALAPIVGAPEAVRRLSMWQRPELATVIPITGIPSSFRIPGQYCEIVFKDAPYRITKVNE